MKKVFTVFSVFMLFNSLVLQAQHNTRKDFNEGWKFTLDSVQSFNDPAFNDGTWRKLNIPHDVCMDWL